MTKSTYMSKTVWLNVITLLIAALAIPDVANLIPPENMKYALAVSAVLNLVLRIFFTKTELT